MSDLSITALYTAETWAWGRFSCAELFASPEGRRVFDATNAALAVARLARRDLAPLRESLVQRHAMIDRLAREAIDVGVRQIVELAAGLSRRGAAMSADPRVRYVELDLPAMVARKRALLERSDAGRAVLARPNLALVASDVATVDLGAHVAAGEPVLVVCEGLLMYLDAAAQADLFARVRRLADGGGAGRDVRFVFDLVPGSEEPPPGAVGRALGRAMKRFTGGRGFERDARTRDDLVAALGAAGFADARAFDGQTVARAWELPCPDAPTRTVVFSARTLTTSPATRS